MKYLERIENIVGADNKDFDMMEFVINNQDKLPYMESFQNIPEATPAQRAILDNTDINAFVSGEVEIPRSASPTDAQIEAVISILEKLMGDNNAPAPELDG